MESIFEKLIDRIILVPKEGRKFSFRVNGDRRVLPVLFIYFPGNATDQDLVEYLEKNKDFFVSLLGIAKDQEHDANSSTQEQTKPTKQKEGNKKIGNYSFRFEYEGYKVYVCSKRNSDLVARIYAKDIILVDVPKEYDTDTFLISYLNEKLSKMIDAYYKLKQRLSNPSKHVIDKVSFSYCNPINDIDDSILTRQSKHKRKEYTTSPTKTEGYVGESNLRKLLGKRAIDPVDGRFKTLEQKPDYGLEDRND